MPTVVSLSKAQRHFRRVHDEAMTDLVEIQSNGRTTAYLISADMLKEIWDCYRKSRDVSNHSHEEKAT